MSSVFDNVIFQVYKLTKSDTTKTLVLGSTPATPTNYKGHLQEINQAPESKTDGVADKDRYVAFRLLVKYDKEALKFLKTGMIVRLTKIKHPLTGKFVNVPADHVGYTQFNIQSSNTVNTDNTFMNFGLVGKDA